MTTAALPKVTTLESARKFVLAEKVCSVLSSKQSGIRSLWDAVALPDKQAGEKGWGQKMVAVWTWKTQLPSKYPDEIYYGKIEGGTAVLMAMDHLRREHYPKHHREVRLCSPLAQRAYELIRGGVCGTGDLRKTCMNRFGCTRGKFEQALKELQITLNIVRSNDPKAVNDTWLPFREQYWDICREIDAPRRGA